MMYRCNDCDSLFEEPYEYRERDVGFYADWCPYCHSDDIVEVKECKMCGAWTPTHDLFSGFCPACVEKTAHKYDKFMNSCSCTETELFREHFGIEPINY